MTVEVKCEATQVADVAVKVVDKEGATVAEEAKCEKEEEPKTKIVEKSSSYKEESNFHSDLKDHEKKALNELKTRLEEAIVNNTLFDKKAKKESSKKADQCAKEPEKKEQCEEEKKSDISTEEKPNACERIQETEEKESEVELDLTNISIWGVPLLPSKAKEGTNVVLLKFLRAREFKVNDAFTMLKKALQWRKEFKIESILEEEFGSDLSSAAYMNGVDREGRPVCYNVFGVLDNEEVYEKTLATEEKREQFLRWRVQLMEKGIQELDLKPGGISSLVQVNDLKSSSVLSRKEVRAAVNKTVVVLQDNYPEFVAKNIFINVPFWYFAFHSMLSPFLTQRTKSKLVFARPSKVTDTLLKYIPIQEIPIQYGGIKRENDFEFSDSDGEPVQVVIKAGATEIIEIPTPEDGATFIWDLIVLGWDVKYTEEFVPTDENSYTKIIQKGMKICSNEAAIRKTFKNEEPGKIVLTIQNSSGKKKKVFYQYKVKKACF